MDQDRGEAKELQLEEFLELLPHLEGADLMAISASYEQADAGARDAARAAASVIAHDRGLIDELGKLQGSIIQWASSDISQSAAMTLAGVRPNQVLGDIRMQAVSPLLDAATALLLRNAIPDDERDALLEPLRAAIG